MSSASTKPNRKFDDDAEVLSERWLISYSDLVTTLMVLFIALYAMQLAKHRELETKNLAVAPVEKNLGDAHTHVPRTVALEQLRASRKELISSLKVLRDKQEILVRESARGVEIEINAKILFRSGEAHLMQDSDAVLDQVATALKEHSAQQILVEGHTDSVPISTTKYESNWELSSARAGSLVRFLVDRGIEPHRLAAIGRADNIPAVMGDDPLARAANRRVVIVVQYDLSNPPQ
ncbi:motility protein B [Caballeronia mineralivorans PML1(12)]|uniref:Motility protein B n=1 Tax=Caballeronia mineralivorans PML1(12) TaxID=908627 RepID=A0A0J1CKP4_9BURK|nr:OmpA family protein [Caballeronia mineralivorans]KLU21292.1 motility protein B [Caballeronia mineralivorans PML1(12)]